MTNYREMGKSDFRAGRPARQLFDALDITISKSEKIKFQRQYDDGYLNAAALERGGASNSANGKVASSSTIGSSFGGGSISSGGTFFWFILLTIAVGLFSFCHPKLTQSLEKAASDPIHSPVNLALAAGRQPTQSELHGGPFEGEVLKRPEPAPLPPDTYDIDRLQAEVSSGVITSAGIGEEPAPLPDGVANPNDRVSLVISYNGARSSDVYAVYIKGPVYRNWWSCPPTPINSSSGIYRCLIPPFDGGDYNLTLKINGQDLRSWKFNSVGDGKIKMIDDKQNGVTIIPSN